MNYLTKIKLICFKCSLYQKFLILILTILFIAFSAVGLYIYYSQKNGLIKNADNRMYGHLDELVELLNYDESSKQDKVNIALNVAHEIFYNDYTLQKSDAIIEVEAINQITKKKQRLKINRWLFNDKQLYKNYEIVDRIKNLSVETATIFQKIPDGYLRISTNVKKLDGERAVGTFIPNESPVIQTIERDSTYRGRAYVVNNWYLTAYEPIKIDGEIQGILYVGLKEHKHDFLSKTLKNKTYFESGFPFIVDYQGNYVIHPTKQGLSALEEPFFLEIKKSLVKRGKKIVEIDVDDKIKKQYIYYQYFKPYDSYIALSIYEEDILKELKNVIWIVLAEVILFMGLFSTIIFVLVKPVIKQIREIRDNIDKLANGEITEKMVANHQDEIGDMIEAVNKLIESLSNVAKFADEIGQGKLDSTLDDSERSQLSKSLLEMRDSLVKAQAEEAKRKQEDKQRNWATNGLAKLGDILRQNNDNLNELSYNIISYIVKYLEASQGGIYLINDDNEQNVFIELTAAYAYDRQKFLTKQIEIGEGLIGACFIEKNTVYLTEIPDDYLMITSGLGKGNPTNLLIQPLLFNDKIFGIMEIASFQKLEEFKIEFVKTAGESIASTISSVKINVKTARLLEESRNHSEQMVQQEEEMRQNLEEMRATQEESQRREEELNIELERVKEELQTLKEKLKKQR